jgi:hypothetical protein
MQGGCSHRVYYIYDVYSQDFFQYYWYTQYSQYTHNTCVFYDIVYSQKNWREHHCIYICIHTAIQSVTGLFKKYSNIYNGSLLNSLVTPYIIDCIVNYEIGQIIIIKKKFYLQLYYFPLTSLGM